MNTVTVTGWLQSDPMIEHVGDLVVCELRLDVERPTPDRRTGLVSVTCFGRLAVTATERLTIGDFVGVTGWLRTQPADTDDDWTRQRVDVVAECLDVLGHSIEPPVARDAHREAAYDDRYELDEVS
jgi:single-stranded DNA-binding protein